MAWTRSYRTGRLSKTSLANNGWLTVFNKFNEEQEEKLDLQGCSKSELCVHLSKLYIAAKTQYGVAYQQASLPSLRSAMKQVMLEKASMGYHCRSQVCSQQRSSGRSTKEAEARRWASPCHSWSACSLETRNKMCWWCRCGFTSHTTSLYAEEDSRGSYVKTILS